MHRRISQEENTQLHRRHSCKTSTLAIVWQA